MKFKTVSFVLIASLFQGVSLAQSLSPEEALERFEKNYGSTHTRGAADYNLAYTYPDIAGNPSTYIFNSGDAGFVILPADEIAYPMLGYSETGKIDPYNLPPQLECLLEQYSIQITEAKELGLRAHPLASRSEESQDWIAIPPMVNANWNQSTPYNDTCPADGSALSLTGCVATSMAQVMNYFGYPAKGQGNISYNCNNLGETLSMDFSQQIFDWDNMLPDYITGEYTETEALAVATLMKACGYSIEMEYSATLSLANSYKVPSALVKYFGYAESCQYASRKTYSSSEWSALIYENLHDCGPVIYDATSPLAGGHSFVCDGYDGHGYFHFNWGWGGSSNGYYSLDALNPAELGTGVGSVTGFNIDQDAVIGIRLPDGNDYNSPLNLILHGSLTATVDGDNIRFGATNDNWTDGEGLANENAEAITFAIGAFITSLNGGSYNELVDGTIGGSSEISLLPYTMSIFDQSNYPVITLPAGIPDGEYSVTLACRDMDFVQPDWQPVKSFYGCPNYVKLTVTNSIASVQDISPAKMEVPEAAFYTGVYYTRAAGLTATLVNNSDLEITKSLTPVLLYNGQRFFTGETILVTIGAYSTIEKEWVTRFHSSSYITGPTEFTLILIDAESNNSYGEYGAVLMEMDPGSPIVSLQNLSIENSTVSSENIEGLGETTVYVLTNINDFQINLNINVIHGYLANQIILSVNELDKINTQETIYQNYAFGYEGEEWSNLIDASYPEADADVVYVLTAKYWAGSYYREIGDPIYFKVDKSKVNSLLNNPEEYRYFNLKGHEVKNPRKGDILIRKNGTKSEKIIF